MRPPVAATRQILMWLRDTMILNTEEVELTGKHKRKSSCWSVSDSWRWRSGLLPMRKRRCLKLLMVPFSRDTGAVIFVYSYTFHFCSISHSMCCCELTDYNKVDSFFYRDPDEAKDQETDEGAAPVAYFGVADRISNDQWGGDTQWEDMLEALQRTLEGSQISVAYGKHKAQGLILVSHAFLFINMDVSTLWYYDTNSEFSVLTKYILINKYIGYCFC
ncbi:hypothetical protein C5167_022866 [Papaver somniferum]|uniref:Uncharacterized protein n=1 Tax=Papaver somniferum TaxID=3469 RepID=A0A4Y7JM45_PAPSO|nr:hypothetical protein C5167_022866 [Papaver somniferum]